MADERAQHEVTQILEEWRAGDKSAADRLFPLVYDELKRSARAYLRRESRGGEHTLQPTALVHEAYLRMVGQTALAIENRTHFYALASRVMRRILVDYARQHNASVSVVRRLTFPSISVNMGLPTHSAVHRYFPDTTIDKLLN